MHENIEEYVIISNRKTEEGKWLWTRDNIKVADELARNLNREFLDQGLNHVVITVVETNSGSVILCFK